jgi:uncharacterized protein (TIRG00374 family)
MTETPSTSSPSSPRGAGWTFWLKLVLGIGLLAALLLWRDNGRRMVEHFARFRIEFVVLLLGAALVLNGVSCAKWQLFLRERGVRVGFMRLFNLYLIGKFASNFMPSMIGGDLTRIYLLGRQIASHSQSAASVFMERFTGLIALVCLVLAFAALNPDLLQEPHIAATVAAVALGCVALLALLRAPRLLDWVAERLAWVPGARRVFPRLQRLHQDIHLLITRPRLLAGAMAYSFGFHLATCVLTYFCCLAIAFRPAFLDVALVTPLILLLTAVPVSPNNIGWWEWCFSVFLVGAGAEPSQGLAVALTLRAVTLLMSLAGGVLLLFERGDTSPSARVE